MKKGLALFLLAILMGPAMASADIDDGLVLHYELDGNAEDASGNGHHGALYPDVSDGPQPIDDRNSNVDSAYFFDGDDDHIDTADFELTEEFTVSMWVNPQNPSSYEKFIGKHNEAGRNIFVLGIHAHPDENKYVYSVYTEEGGYFSTTRAVRGWQHFVVVVKPIAMKIHRFGYIEVDLRF